ncbi:hypothetical protein [Caproicibacterium amylolyticum]|uniref:Uncharacterized protein n=1 Tax=Caproicibacterium amylolyticum TaxID=2766537 RepID=A0A7G9WF75_9FIRM|nr:hypothetical protein [Caproicibacterium amylolyticum]QNO17337.1 hypothetical protein H6X83_10335 [Caproicibacterium amylolyticum]
MTTWLELHQEMPRHKKLLVLARLLKVDRRYAVGIMIDLWTWSLDNADSDGNLSGMTADDIEMALDWPVKKSGDLIAALLKAKLLEDRGGTYALHDWADYTGKLSERREIKREQDRKRQEKRRQKKCDTGEKKSVTNEECHAPVTRDVTHVSHENRGDYPTVPDRTVPDLVLKDLDLKQEPLCPKVPTADAGDFEEVQKAFSGKVKAEPSALDERSLAELLIKHGKSALLAAIEETCVCHGHSVQYVKAVLENSRAESGQRLPAGQKSNQSSTDLSGPERYKKFAKGSVSQ